MAAEAPSGHLCWYSAGTSEANEATYASAAQVDADVELQAEHEDDDDQVELEVEVELVLEVELLVDDQVELEVALRLGRDHPTEALAGARVSPDGATSADELQLQVVVAVQEDQRPAPARERPPQPTPGPEHDLHGAAYRPQRAPVAREVIKRLGVCVALGLAPQHRSCRRGSLVGM